MLDPRLWTLEPFGLCGGVVYSGMVNGAIVYG